MEREYLLGPPPEGPPPSVNGHAPHETPFSQAEHEVSCEVGYQPFPVDALPGEVRPFVEAVAGALGCDVGFVVPHALAVIGGLLGNKVRIALKRSWHEPPVVWSVVLQESGTLKSPAWQAVVGAVYRIQEELFKRHEIELERHESDLSTWKENSGDAASKPRKPIRPRLIVSDSTIEKLVIVLQQNPAGVLVARDELSALIGGFDRYARCNGSEVGSYLEMHRAGPVLVDRKGTGGDGFTFYIPRAAVSICGTCQPGVFAKLMTEHFRSSGLLARMLVTMPPRRAMTWTDDDVPEEIGAAFADLLGCLASKPTPKEPISIPLSAPAKARWVRFYNQWSADHAAAVGEMGAAYSKLMGYAARFALLHHVVVNARNEIPGEIEIESIEAGIALARWFASEMERVYGVLERTKGDSEVEEMVTFIKSKGGRVTPKDVCRWNRVKYPSCEAAEIALHKLDRFGRWSTGTPGEKGGRPSTWFTFNGP